VRTWCCKCARKCSMAVWREHSGIGIQASGLSLNKRRRSARNFRTHALRAARRSYVADGNPAQISIFESKSSSALAEFAALRGAVADSQSQEARIADLEIAVRARLALFKQSIELHRGTANDQKGQDAISVHGVKLSAHVADQLRIFDDVERDILQRHVADAEVISRRATRINECLGGSVFIFLILAVRIVNRELSRRARAEIAVGKERKLLQSILNSCSDVVVVADETGTIILRNPAADRLYHKVTDEALSETHPKLLEFYRDDGVTRLAEQDVPLALTIRGESVDALELYVKRADLAEGRYFLAAGGPLLDDRGDRRGGVIFLRDITQRKLDNERLTAALFESERITREQSHLTKLTDLFQSCQDVEEACKVVEALSFGIFDSRPGVLCLTNSSRNLVASYASWGDCSSTKQVFEPSDCWGLRQGKPYVGEDTVASLRCSHVVELGPGYLCVPLVAQGETYGVLYIEDRPALSASSPKTIGNQKQELRHLATAVAERISLAVANLRLREVLRHQSIQDPLTGLSNRRHLEESLNREVHRAARAQRVVSVAMLDIDHFKQFNDSFGHQAGDMLLREAAAVLKGRLRAGDLACRYGGEEFALILAEADADAACSCVAAIRESIKGLTVQFRGRSLGSVTVSAGIATFPRHSNNSEDLIHMADVALYRAKKEGRDRVVVCAEHELVSKLDGAF
jgi:diguanylate cyclase (GGDEF)-like protein/PAS domain S-box-containing protein